MRPLWRSSANWRARCFSQIKAWTHARPPRKRRILGVDNRGAVKFIEHLSALIQRQLVLSIIGMGFALLWLLGVGYLILLCGFDDSLEMLRTLVQVNGVGFSLYFSEIANQEVLQLLF